MVRGDGAGRPIRSYATAEGDARRDTGLPNVCKPAGHLCGVAGLVSDFVRAITGTRPAGVRGNGFWALLDALSTQS